ncbi:MAG: cytotoxic translational repressor of toxin-antitoxin stability system [Desulfovibrio sp.]|jgi:hypothetical protein|nr:cytotoxic translational repressor of toxin-antitoxin stability system [Desulfovibrio sp.]
MNVTTPGESLPWKVEFTGKAKRQKEMLPVRIQCALVTLRNALALDGPVQVGWKNYGKITDKKDMYHCHLNAGKPRYVAIWKVVDKQKRYMEIRYVGTHENADYRHIN